MKRRRSDKVNRLKSIEAEPSLGSELRVERAALGLSSTMLDEQIRAAEEEVATLQRQWAAACRNCCLAKYRTITKILETLGPVHDTLAGLRKDDRPAPWQAIADGVAEIRTRLQATEQGIANTAQRVNGLAEATADKVQRVEQRLDAHQASLGKLVNEIETALRDMRQGTDETRRGDTPADSIDEKAAKPSTSTQGSNGTAPKLPSTTKAPSGFNCRVVARNR